MASQLPRERPTRPLRVLRPDSDRAVNDGRKNQHSPVVDTGLHRGMRSTWGRACRNGDAPRSWWDDPWSVVTVLSTEEKLDRRPTAADLERVQRTCASSQVMTRSRGVMAAASQLSRVVLPACVAPRTASRAGNTARRPHHHDPRAEPVRAPREPARRPWSRRPAASRSRRATRWTRSPAPPGG